MNSWHSICGCYVLIKSIHDCFVKLYRPADRRFASAGAGKCFALDRLLNPSKLLFIRVQATLDSMLDTILGAQALLSTDVQNFRVCCRMSPGYSNAQVCKML
jgi:hypothetical protein